MKKTLLFTFFCALLGLLFAAEPMSLISYYPSPRGIYTQMTVNETAIAPTGTVGGTLSAPSFRINTIEISGNLNFTQASSSTVVTTPSLVLSGAGPDEGTLRTGITHLKTNLANAAIVSSNTSDEYSGMHIIDTMTVDNGILFPYAKPPKINDGLGHTTTKMVWKELTYFEDQDDVSAAAPKKKATFLVLSDASGGGMSESVCTPACTGDGRQCVNGDCKCVLPTYEDPVSHTCKSCGAQASYNATLGICICNESGKIFYDYSETCESCPNTYQNVVTGTNTCECPANSTLNPHTHACVCNAGCFGPSRIAGRYTCGCQICLTEGQEFNSLTGQCECTGGRILAEGTCVCPSGDWDESTQQCEEEQPICLSGWHWDSDEGECVEDKGHPICIPGSHWDSDLQACVSDDATRFCPVGQVWSGVYLKCIPDCPAEAPYDPKLDSCGLSIGPGGEIRG